MFFLHKIKLASQTRQEAIGFDSWKKEKEKAFARLYTCLDMKGLIGAAIVVGCPSPTPDPFSITDTVPLASILRLGLLFYSSLERATNLAFSRLFGCRYSLVSSEVCPPYKLKPFALPQQMYKGDLFL